MPRKNTGNFLLISTAALVVGGVMFFLWQYLGNTTNIISTQENTQGEVFGVPATNIIDQDNTQNNKDGVALRDTSTVQIVSISDQPIAGATIIQTTQPISTVARYMQQENGHIYDLPLDITAGTPRPVSNITMPGVQKTFWVQGGRGVLAQYIQNDRTIKTAYIDLEKDSASSSSQTRMRFLPDNVQDIAVSPSGAFIIYLTRPDKGGTTGYLAKADGSEAKILFTVPLSQTFISWPATTTMLLQTAATSGVEGAVFAINSSSGIVAPLLFGKGITATANNTFSKVLFTTAQSSDSATLSYSRDIRTGNTVTFPSGVLPEKCAWSHMNSSVLYCAKPLGTMLGDYLDSLYFGNIPENDYISVTSTLTGNSIGIAVPGSRQGGKKDRIGNIVVATNDRYILYTNQSDRSLSAVIITQ